MHFTEGEGEVSDIALETRRARAAAMLMLALPGGAYIYQGEELGLPQVDDLPDEVLRDPVFRRSGGTMRGRDGYRVPLPWSGENPPFGFSPDEVHPWLPQPKGWASLTVESVVNISGKAVPIGPDARILLCSVPIEGEYLPSDATVWLKT